MAKWRRKYKRVSKYPRRYVKKKSLYKKMKKWVPRIIEQRAEHKKIHNPAFGLAENILTLASGATALVYGIPGLTVGTSDAGRIGNRIRMHHLRTDFRCWYSSLAGNTTSNAVCIFHEFRALKGRVGEANVTLYNNVGNLAADADWLALAMNPKPLFNYDNAGCYIFRSKLYDAFNMNTGSIVYRPLNHNSQTKTFNFFSKKGKLLEYTSSTADKPSNWGQVFLINNQTPHTLNIRYSQIMTYTDI